MSNFVNLMDIVYPIGSIYQSIGLLTSISAQPSYMLGGVA